MKADDYGLALVRTRGGWLRAAGRTLVKAMPGFMQALTVIGTAAMLWVGGNIVLHGLEVLGFSLPYETIRHWSELASHAVPQAGRVLSWLVTAILDGIFGLALGLLLIPINSAVLAPAWRRARALFGTPA